MKSMIVLILASWPLIGWGELEIPADDTLQMAFANLPQTIKVMFRNSSKESMLEMNLQTRLFQTSSSTLMALGASQPWKKLKVLPDQTVLETITLTFPSIKAGTQFQIQWQDENGNFLGQTNVMVYPEDILKQLKQLSGEKPVGILDPTNQLKPTLKRFKIDFEDLEIDQGLMAFHGKLAIVGPFALKEQVPTTLSQQIAKQASKGIAIIWIQPPDIDSAISILPAYIARFGVGTVVMVKTSLVADLAQSAKSQFNLIYLASMAVNFYPLQFPSYSEP